MAIFKPKNYSTIVAPLAKMATTLKTYISTQMAAIESLKQNRQEIDHQISFSKEEIAKSSATAKNIGDLININTDDIKPDKVKPETKA